MTRVRKRPCQFPFTLPADLRARLQALADREALPVAAIIRRAIVRYLQETDQ